MPKGAAKRVAPAAQNDGATVHTITPRETRLGTTKIPDGVPLRFVRFKDSEHLFGQSLREVSTRNGAAITLANGGVWIERTVELAGGKTKRLVGYVHVSNCRGIEFPVEIG